MTKITFLHSAPDRVSSALDWVRRAFEQRQPVVIYVPHAETAESVDRLLWTRPALTFLPHCRTSDPLAAETLVLIAQNLDAVPHSNYGHCLLNLSDDLTPDFSKFKEVVEIVSASGPDRQPARDRFKFYREQGHSLENKAISI